MDTTTKFAALFAGRLDVVGTDDGGCERLCTAFDEEHAVWQQVWHEHLCGNKPIGIYPLMLDNTVRWGCVDIDTGNKPGALYETWDDAWQHSVLLRRVLAQLGIEAWIERTRSDGAHIWVFACEPVRAAAMRRALLAAHQIAGLPQKEVNPKQEQLAEGKVGNYVRLPYPFGGEKQYVLDPDDLDPMRFDPDGIYLDEFVTRAYETRMPASTYEQAAELYQPETATPRPVASNLDFTAVRNKSAYAAKMVENGPVGQDRSSYLWHLAKTMSEADIAFRDAWDVICEADRRWGKFHQKNDVESLWDLLSKAYA